MVTLTGSIDLSSVSQIQRALVKDLSEEPFALICDLAGVDTLDPVCASVFATVANHPSSRWPATGFLLCAQPPVAEVLGVLTVPHFLQLYASLQDALDAAVARPRTCAMSWCWPRSRPRQPPPARLSGRFWATGSSACPTPRWWIGRCWWRASWSPTPSLHARTELVLRVELREDLLHLAVRDGSPQLLRLVTDPVPDPEAEGGRGLWLVEQLARAWGVNRHPDGGKVVWCTLHLGGLNR